MRFLLATALVAIVVAAGPLPPAAQTTTGPSSVLTGSAAFGAWDQSRPGVRRLIRPADLPPPNATPSANNQPRLVARPASPPFALPVGFEG